MRTSTFISKSLKCAVISFFFIVAGTFNSNAQQYCSVSGDCTEGDQIHNFSTTGALVNITNNNSGCSPGGYGNFTSTHSMTVSPGMTVNISVQTLPTSSYEQGFAIWIDWNQNMNFSDPGELVWNSSTYGTQVFTGSFTVPLTATPGTTRMRVMCSYYCVPSNPCSPCDTYNETEDYTVIVSGGTDAGLESFFNLPDTICSGPQPVEVVLKNHGPFNLTSVDIEWAVDNVTQPTFNWTGALAASGTDTVMIGTYPFVQGMNYQIMAYTSGPNNSTDTVNHNDTIVKPEVVTKPSPELVLNDTLLNICQGDTAYINGTLTGTAPWSLMISDGTTNVPVTNITANAFSIPVTPASSKTYTITSLMDATGCENKSIYSVEIVVQPAPPAIITPLGSTAACEGDSVSLMASIGLNFGYQWYKDGVVLPNDTSYTYSAKESGQYTVEVMNPIGCSNMSDPLTVIIHPAPQVNLGKDTALLPSQNIMLDAGPGFNTYAWSTGATSQTIVVDSSGTGIGVKTVWVIVTDNYTCPGGDTVLINFTNHPGIEESSINAQLSIFPNPTDGYIELILSHFPSGFYELKVFNQSGKLVYSENYHITEVLSREIVDLSNLPDGMYIMQIISNEMSRSEKVIIVR